MDDIHYYSQYIYGPVRFISKRSRTEHLLLKSNVTFDTFLGITESQSSMSHCLCQTDSTTSSGGGTKRKIANSLISSNLLTAGGT